MADEIDGNQQRYAEIEDSLRRSVAVNDPAIEPILRRWSSARIHYEIQRGPEPCADNDAFLLVRTFKADRDELKKYRWPETGRLIEFATDTLEPEFAVTGQTL